MDRETRLDLIAASILEGVPVDWASVESASAPEDLAVLRQLRVLEEVAVVHREVSAGGSTSGTRTGTLPSGRAETPAMWGHLRLFECVGRGSFGEVYRAWDTHLDREVALKLLRARPGPDDPSASISDPDRVVHEGRLLARVRHPHVITVYGAEPRDGRVGIWMEFIRGTTLHRLVEQQGRLGAREAVAIGTDLCRALAAVHRAGLLHRDISARNVMREEGGRLVLMDFGAGYDAGEPRERSGGITGTPLYMAPELFAGDAADARADIYSLGTLLFHLVTARYPVSGRSLTEVREAHARGDRTRLRDLRPDVPPAFIRVVEQAVDADPRRRFQTAGELEAALEAIEPAAREIREPGARHRWIAAAVIAGAAIGVAAVVSYVSPDGLTTGGGQPDVTTSAALTTRRVEYPSGIWPFSNPSSDGRFVAGMVEATGDAGLVDLPRGAFQPLGISSDPDRGYASLGALSPDGSRVAVDFHDDRGGNLYVIPTDGGRPRLLIDAPADTRPYEWSRDGSMLLARVERQGQSDVIGLIAASDGAVRELAAVNRVPPVHASLSPDGRYVTYDAPARPGAAERDIFVLDAHTGSQWAFEPSPSDESSPFWSPDGRSLVFLSDRNRNPSLWVAPIENGRLSGAARLAKDNVGRVWLRGFTADGALHYQLYAGFAEVFLAPIDGAQAPQPMSPRRAVSNFYPMWSPDGRLVAYAAERSDTEASNAARELWVYDTLDGTERAVPVGEPIGRPVGWSPDSREILVGGQNGNHLLVVDHASGRSRAIAAKPQGRAAWGPAGVLAGQQGQIVLINPAAGRVLRTIGPLLHSEVAADGRSVISQGANGQLAVVDPASGATRTWQDSGVEQLGNHFLAPHTTGVAYVAWRKGVTGESKSLMYWGGTGDPKELLRVSEPDPFALVGWLPDDRTLLVVRFSRRSNAPDLEPRNETLWRVPVTGGPPVSTGLTIEGLRDGSIHPDGRRLAFNAGWKRAEQWVMENVLPR